MAWSPDYVTADELKAFVRIDDTEDDAEVALAVTAASRAIDRTCHRQFGIEAAPVARYYSARLDTYRRRWVVDIDDLMTETGLTVKFDSGDDGTYGDVIDQFQLKPVNAATDKRPWTQLVVHPNSAVQPTALLDAVEVTATFGWTQVPAAIKEAALLQASRLLWRRDAPAGVAGSPDAGSEVRLLAKVDPDVQVTITDYIRPKRRVG